MPGTQADTTSCFACRHARFCITWQAVRGAILTSPVVNFGRSASFRQLADLVAGECNVGPEITEEAAREICAKQSASAEVH